MKRQIKVEPTVSDLIHEAARRIVDAATHAVADRGKFTLALSGGKTPEGLYQLLAADFYRSQIDWNRVHVFFGDERCVPPDSKESNFRMAHAALLSKVPIPAEQIHRMRGEIEPNQAATEYGELLKTQFGDGGLDLILLGMGDDGHTASLFPQSPALAERKHRCVANPVARLNAWRITLTAPFINKAQAVMVLIAGADKSARLQEVLEGPRDPTRLPIQLIEPEHGTMTWLLDAGAAGMHAEE